MQTDPTASFGGIRRNGDGIAGTAELPLVTIITAVYNGASYLSECIESVLRQDYPNIEHIIVDGGSTDGSIEILRSYADRIAWWVSEPDDGVYDAWNKGLALARGQWISFLGSDDVYLSDAVSAYMHLALANPDTDYLCSPIKWTHPAGYSRTLGGPWQWPRFCREMCSIHVGSMHRAKLFEQYGSFDTSYRITGDYEFLLRPRAHLRSAFLSVPTVTMRAGGVSDSVAALREAYRAKVETGGRQKALAFVDLTVALLKYRLKSFLHNAALSFNPAKGQAKPSYRTYNSKGNQP